MHFINDPPVYNVKFLYGTITVIYTTVNEVYNEKRQR